MKKRYFQDKDYYLLALLAKLGPSLSDPNKSKFSKITREYAHMAISKMLSCSSKDEIVQYLQPSELWTWLLLIDDFIEDYPFEQVETEEDKLKITKDMIDLLKEFKKALLSHVKALDLQHKKYLKDIKGTVESVLTKSLEHIDELIGKSIESYLKELKTEKKVKRSKRSKK